MQDKCLKFILLLILFHLYHFNSTPNCALYENNCIKCNNFTGLCVKCQNPSLTPDSKGGCTGANLCTIGMNYCEDCNLERTLCVSCPMNYYPDLNGGCSTTPHCALSYRGLCFECSSGYFLVQNNLFCKPENSPDLANCETINRNTGFCDWCKEGYYLNSIDKKCIKTQACATSTYDT